MQRHLVSGWTLVAAVWWGVGSHAIADDACLVCGEKPAKGHAHIAYRGTFYRACENICEKAWYEAKEEGALDAIVAKIEPRAALFQGDSKFLNPAFQEQHPMGSRWMVAGVWILSAVVTAGVASAMAVGTHRSIPSAFVIGFLFPVIGLGLTCLLPKKKETFVVRGTKLPTTYAEIRCEACSHSLHPSARTCPGCGVALTPTVESEVMKVDLVS